MKVMLYGIDDGMTFKLNCLKTFTTATQRGKTACLLV